MAKCMLCPRKCGADRENGERGMCGAGRDIKCARAALHMWEEPCISGSGGSGAVFFGGCPLRCVYCQNAEISRGGVGSDISVRRLSEIFRELEGQGAENINLVSPTPYARQIAQALEIYRPRVPIVYNTSGYERISTLELIEPYIDIYLPDLKYVDGDISQKYSAAADYPQYACAAVRYMVQKRPPVYDGRGMLRSGVIVRHLVLPSKVTRTYHVLAWLAENIPRSTPISLMGQYFPAGQAGAYPEINRKLTAREYGLALDRAQQLGFESIFFQELSSASSDFVPPFDLSGV